MSAVTAPDFPQAQVRQLLASAGAPRLLSKSARTERKARILTSRVQIRHTLCEGIPWFSSQIALKSPRAMSFYCSSQGFTTNSTTSIEPTTRRHCLKPRFWSNCAWPEGRAELAQPTTHVVDPLSPTHRRPLRESVRIPSPNTAQVGEHETALHHLPRPNFLDQSRFAWISADETCPNRAESG